MLALFNIWSILFQAASFIVVVHVILSILISFNIINTHNELVRTVWDGLNRLLDPIYRPIRKYMPDMGALDLSPMALLILLQILNVIVRRVLLGF
jgi:YggT family protein